MYRTIITPEVRGVAAQEFHTMNLVWGRYLTKKFLLQHLCVSLVAHSASNFAGSAYSLYQLFTNTQAGARFADKTRQALAFDQLRNRRTHIIAYAGGHFEIFETLSFVHWVLQLPAAVQERLRHWLDEHLHTVIQRE